MRTFLELVKSGNTSANALTEFLFNELNIPVDEREKDFNGVIIHNVFTIRERFKRKSLKYREARNFFKQLTILGLNAEAIQRARLLYNLRENIPTIRETLRRYGLKCKIYRSGSEKTRDATVSYIGELVEEREKLKHEIVSRKITQDNYDIYLGLIYGYPLGEILGFIRKAKYNGAVHRNYTEEK